MVGYCNVVQVGKRKMRMKVAQIADKGKESA